METPTGYIDLRDAADAIGRKIAGKEWRSLSVLDHETIICKLDPTAERVIARLAEQCEAGEISAAYRSIAGAEPLDRAVWLVPHWRNYFATGTIDLDLPMIVEHRRPSPDGFTVRCTRQVFVRKDELDRFIAGLGRPHVRRRTRVSDTKIKEIVASYLKSIPTGKASSHDGLESFARDNCGVLGNRHRLRSELRRQRRNQLVSHPSGNGPNRA